MLASVEWDFADRPNEQLFKCWYYEFAREVEWIKRQHKKQVRYKTKGPGAYWVAFDHDRRLKPLTKESPSGFILWLPPGFPDTPFELLDPSLKEDVIPIITVTDDDPNLGLSALRLLNENQECRQFDGMQITKHILEIWWDFSDEEIVTDFRHLVKHLRKGYKAHEKRGHSVFKAYRRDLRALGAFRLLKKMTAKKAEDHSQSVRGEKGPLFSTEGNWSKAKSHAEAILRKKFLWDGGPKLGI